MFIVNNTASLTQQSKKNRHLQTIKNGASSTSRSSSKAKKQKHARKNNLYQASKSEKNSRQHVILFHAEFYQSGSNHYKINQNENKLHGANQIETNSYESETNQYEEYSYYLSSKNILFTNHIKCFRNCTFFFTHIFIYIHIYIRIHICILFLRCLRMIRERFVIFSNIIFEKIMSFINLWHRHLSKKQIQINSNRFDFDLATF